MHLAAVRWSLLPRNQRCPRNIRCTLTANRNRNSLFSCRCSERSLSSQQATLPCVFRDNLRSTGWVYMEGWDDPTVRACYDLKEEARGGLQIHLRQVAPPPHTEPKHTGSTNIKCAFGETVANSIRKSNPMTDVCVGEPAATENVTTGYFHNYLQLSKTYWD